MELTRTQLELVVLIANGKRVTDVAELTHRSPSSVKQILGTARRRAGATTMAHLVSLVISTGVLEWSVDDNERKLTDDYLDSQEATGNNTTAPVAP